MDYSMFPYWMGINSFGDVIGICILFILLSFMYILFGYGFCPNSLKKQWERALYILFWPLIFAICILLFPLIALYEFSKPADVQEKELNEFIRKSRDNFS